MADPDFPKIVGSALIRGYKYQDQSVDITSTVMESGAIRRRQRSKNVPSNFQVSFMMTDLQLSVFEYFNQVILGSLTSRFNIELKTGQGVIAHNVKYAEPPVVSRTGFLFNVGCNFEVATRVSSS